MVLGCSLCNQPLLIRPTKIGSHNPSSLMTRGRKNEPEKNSNKITNIEDAEIVATKCGHMFHLQCMKNYLIGQSDIKLKSSKLQGCPMCFKPVVQSQLWPIVLRPTAEEMEKIDRINHLRIKNGEISKAMQEIRTKTKATNKTLQDARTRMFEHRMKMHIIDTDCSTSETYEKLEKTRKDMEEMIGVVNHQNIVLTMLTEQVSTCGQKIRSEQSVLDIQNNSVCRQSSLEVINPVPGLVRELLPQRIPPENNVGFAGTKPDTPNPNRQVYDLQIGEQFELIENSVATSHRSDLQEQWDMVKKSFLDRLKEESFIRDVKHDSHHIPSKPNNRNGRRSLLGKQTVFEAQPGQSHYAEAFGNSNKISTTGPASDFWKSMRNGL